MVQLRPRIIAACGAAAIVGALGLVSCRQTPPDTGSASRQVQDTSKYADSLAGGPALPPGCKPDRPPKTVAEVNACLKVLEFDTVEALGDKQPLLIGGTCPTCKYGPMATIQPEMHSHSYTYEQIEHGRIIALMFLDPAEKTSYPKLGLVPKGKTYWWVQRTSMDTARTVAGRSVFLTVVGDSLTPHEDRKNNPLRYTYHPGRFKQAVARWIWDPDDDRPQGNCGSGCCH
jgi:hypothetical protein